MPISDLYLVQHLLQETLRHPQNIVWQEKSFKNYSTIVNGVSVDLLHVDSMACSRLVILLSDGFSEVHIAEPLRRGFLRTRYLTVDLEQLAQALHKLAAAVARQCEKRKMNAIASEQDIRESIFRRLLFTAADPTDSEKTSAEII
jgi:hypothetical protein